MRFLEKPLPEETASRNASVVFYTFRRETMVLVPVYLKEHQDISQRTFGAFMTWIINEQKVGFFLYIPYRYLVQLTRIKLSLKQKLYIFLF